MAILKKNPGLGELQQYVKEICCERGWDKNNHLEIFLLLSEEIGELAKAIRYKSGLYIENGVAFDKRALEHEFADVFGYLLDLANYFDVDLEKAFLEKEKINETREWKT